MSNTAHDFSFNSNSGTPINLSDYQGKVLLIVNTASKCGFTKQYSALEELYQDYKDRGLVVIGVPSADFGGQEFASNEKVKEFTESKFDITFQLTEINHVKGKDAHPFYQWANLQSGFVASPKWNFHKYLIDQDGRLVDWFSPATSPKSQKIISKLNELI